MIDQYERVGFDGLRSVPENLFLLNPGNQKIVTGKRNWNYVFKQVGIPLIPLIIMLVIIGLIGGPPILNEIRLLNTETKTTEAKVIDQRISRGKSTSYYLTYEIVLDGVGYRREEQVNRDEYDRSRTGNFVTVTYALNDPDVSHIGTPGLNWERVLPFLVLAGIFLIVAVIMTASGMPAMMRIRRLRREGQMLTGELLWSKSELVKRGSGKSRRTDLDLTIGYRFRTPTGRMIETQITKVRNDLKKKPLPERGMITILYANEMDYEVL